jgi:hypothetical protein
MSHDTTVTTTPTTDVTSDTNIATAERSRRLLRRGGIYGLAASAAYLATGVLTSVIGGIEPPENVADMDRYLSEVSDAPLGFFLYAIAGLALCVLYIPMSRAITDLLAARRTARAGTTSVVAGLVILIPAYVIAAIGSVGLVNRHDAGSDTDTLFDVHELVSTAAEVSFSVGSLLSLGVGPLLWGLAGRTGREIPRWLSRLAIVVGLLGLVWIIPPGVRPDLVVLANVLGSLVLFVALSLRLLRTE